MSVCSLAYLRNDVQTSWNFLNMLPWSSVQYVMYFRFCGWHDVCGLYGTWIRGRTVKVTHQGAELGAKSWGLGLPCLMWLCLRISVFVVESEVYFDMYVKIVCVISCGLLTKALICIWFLVTSEGHRSIFVVMFQQSSLLQMGLFQPWNGDCMLNVERCLLYIFHFYIFIFTFSRVAFIVWSA